VTDSSSIIKDIQDICLAGLATLAIFYFHFGDTTKQDARNLLSSVLFQLCPQSHKFSQALSSIYSSHGNGSREPGIDTLQKCLKNILAVQGQGPLYIVVDALDECPDSSGLRTQRQKVLEILKELIDLKLPHVHYCVTSRPEIDIRRAFDPLNPDDVSLHNQHGQIRDLAEYVNSVVRSDATMRNWPANVKELVIDTLAKKGGGMYVIDLLAASILSYTMTSGFGGHPASWKHYADVPCAVFQVLWMNYQRLWTKLTNEYYRASLRRCRRMLIASSNGSRCPRSR
jgi:hypothetical protein